MCGIAGYSCFDKYDERLNVAIPILALHMEVRGRRSWGWTDGVNEVIKETGEISKSFNPSFFGYKQASLHTRQPTTGNVTKSNSHPFQVGNIIGMHNGVVRNHDELQKKYDRKCEVDSQHIFEHIAEGKDLSEISAYGAIVYYKDGVLHFGKFNGGQLTLVRTEIGWIYASTKEALEIALQFSGLRKGAIFYKLKEDRLYKLVDSKLVQDVKLNFADYNKVTHGTWDKGGAAGASTFPEHGGYGGRALYQNNYQNPGNQTRNIVGSGSDKDGYFTLEWIDGARYKVRANDGKRILTAYPYEASSGVVTPIDKPKKGKLGRSGVNDRISEMLLAISTSKPKEKQRVDDEFPCVGCNDMIANGDLFGMIDNGELVCSGCAASYFADDLVGGILANVLPVDVMLVEAFFEGGIKTNKQEVSCDNCDDHLQKDDWFACAANNTFLCLLCFMEKYMVKKLEDTLDTDFTMEDNEALMAARKEQEDEQDAANALFSQQITESISALNDGPKVELHIPSEDNDFFPITTSMIM